MCMLLLILSGRYCITMPACCAHVLLPYHAQIAGYCNCCCETFRTLASDLCITQPSIHTHMYKHTHHSRQACWLAGCMHGGHVYCGGSGRSMASVSLCVGAYAASLSLCTPVCVCGVWLANCTVPYKIHTSFRYIDTVYGSPTRCSMLVQLCAHCPSLHCPAAKV